jgi:hypothetical protein
MPRIPDHFLANSIYFYGSEEDAKAGSNNGGCGFFVHTPSIHQGIVHIYAITNKHVLDEGCNVLRLNTTDGKTEIIATERDAWIDHPERYDVSIYSIDINNIKVNPSSINTDLFLTREIIDDFLIGPGDETFMVGRLITRWGQQRNRPVVRFGNISMMADPDEPVVGHDNVAQECFFVESRSISGFSGSPVFVSTTQLYTADKHVPKAIKPASRPEDEGMGLKFNHVFSQGTYGPWFLGINCGHLPLWNSVFEKDKVSPTEYRVEQATGIACVLPAWHILDLVNIEELVRERKRDDNEYARRGRD